MPDEVPRSKEYLPRWITPQLQGAVTLRSVVLLTGPKQVGKSTLLVMAAPFRDWRYLTLDDFDTLRLAKESPGALWSGVDRVVIDEVQKAPELVELAVEGTVTFLLAGSTDLDSFTPSPNIRAQVTHFSLRPLALGEIIQSAAPALLTELLQGAWPQAGERAAIVRDPLEHLLHGLLPALIFEQPPSSAHRRASPTIGNRSPPDRSGFGRYVACPPAVRCVPSADVRRQCECLHLSGAARRRGPREFGGLHLTLRQSL